jgi:hypothetical protein
MDMKFEFEDKKKAVGFAILIVICCVLIVDGIFNTPKTSQEVQPQQQVQPKENTAAVKPPVVVASVSDAILKQNPFVDMAGLAKSRTKQLESGKTVMPTGNINLPVIPGNTPRPDVPTSIPLPTIPGNGGGGNMPVPPSTAKEATVQGVLTGNNGSNMAIMSDGKVVSEGDTYKDDRIAYIGGEGITFENGHTIGYK